MASRSQRTPAPCGHRPTTSLAQDAVERRLDAAAARCADAGQAWTAGRRRIYELLVRAGRPVGAYELMLDVSTPGRVAKPPTVYRALDFLVRVGLAHRIDSLNAFFACDHLHGRSALEVLICDCCGRVEEHDFGVEQATSAAASTLGFTTSGLVLEVHGACPCCAR